MVLNYQRWTAPCQCSFEQEVDSETHEVKLLFAHSVCGRHEHIAIDSKAKAKVKSKSKSSLTKDDIIKKKEDALKRNHDRNVDEFENSDHIKKIKRKLSVELLNVNPDENTLLLQDYYDTQKRYHERQLEDFAKARMIDILVGLESDYALDAQEVYDYILAHPEEQLQLSNTETQEGG